MGNWNISIEGIGIHHNKVEKDANEMARKFVKALKEAGHNVNKASFTYGGAEDLNEKTDKTNG